MCQVKAIHATLLMRFSRVHLETFKSCTDILSYLRVTELGCLESVLLQSEKYVVET